MVADFFEIDFLDVEAAKSGDAITVRYEVSGVRRIHVIDAGYQDTGASVVAHIRKHYGNPTVIDHVVASHPDGDHAGGLREILETFTVHELWMHRPWLYASELIPRFSRFTSVSNLEARLRELYPNIAALEEIATRKRIPIRDPFQGQRIGEFVVLAPTRARYLDLIVQSDRTPEAIAEARTAATGLLGQVVSRAVSFLKAAWGIEIFSDSETSAENEMSVVQYAKLCGQRILLTADTGRAGLAEAADFAPLVGLTLPGIDRAQVPHHGSRRNVSTAVLDRWFGSRLAAPPPAGSETFTALISSAKKDEHHPRKAVVRAFIHRGAKVITTEGRSIRTAHNAPDREGWGPVPPEPYPTETEQ
jgi:beta-lactamase superfamily II metal-dependent hydrolase